MSHGQPGEKDGGAEAGGCQPGWGARSTSGEPIAARFETVGPAKGLAP